MATKRRGRPEVSPEDRRSVVIGAHVTEAERDRIAEHAYFIGSSVSNVVRSAALAAVDGRALAIKAGARKRLDALCELWATEPDATANALLVWALDNLNRVNDDKPIANGPSIKGGESGD